MKLLKICLILLFTALVINWARQGRDFFISDTFLFLTKHPPSYILGSLGLVWLLFWGISRLNQNR